MTNNRQFSRVKVRFTYLFYVTGLYPVVLRTECLGLALGDTDVIPRCDAIPKVQTLVSCIGLPYQAYSTKSTRDSRNGYKYRYFPHLCWTAGTSGVDPGDKGTVAFHASKKSIGYLRSPTGMETRD